MIRVVSLSPAIDVTYEITQLNPGQSHRVQRIHREPGGKAANVARVLASGGRQVKLLLPLGGLTGDWLERELSRAMISTQRLPIQSETRSCVTVVSDQVTVLNEPAPALSDVEFEKLLTELAEPAAVTVFSGSVPAGQSPEQLGRLFATVRSSAEQLIVDTSGDALVIACQAGPDLIKPNRAEALAATGEATLEGAVKKLLELGARKVLLSDGERGARLVTPNLSLQASLPERQGNPTGAGDAMVALVALALSQNQTDRELLAQATAAGSLAVAAPTAGVIDWSELEALARTVKIEE